MGIITIIILLASSFGILKTVLEFISSDVTASTFKRAAGNELKMLVFKLLSWTQEKFLIQLKHLVSSTPKSSQLLFLRKAECFKLKTLYIWYWDYVSHSCFSMFTSNVAVNIYCCTVHFDNVQNSFHQQIHSLLNIKNVKTYN